MPKEKEVKFEVWAEKYRPNTFDEIINQSHAVERVKAFAEAKNIPHMLFAGPPGTGKTTLALVLAKELYGKEWRQNVLELNASVTGDTPILIKKNGKIKRTTIGELAEQVFEKDEKYKELKGYEVLSVDKDSLKVEFKKVRNISRHKVNKIAIITLENGAKIKTSLNHSVIVLNDKGELESKEVRELTANDLLITFMTNLQGCEKEMDLSFCKEESLKSCIKNSEIKNFYEKMKVDEDLAYLFDISEGYVDIPSKQFILSFGSHEISEVRKIQNFFEKKFGRNSSSLNFQIFNPQLAKFFVDNYMNGIQIKERTSSLNGYLNDACGEWGRYLRYCSKSKNLLVDAAWLARLSNLFFSIFKNERIDWFRKNSYEKNHLPANVFLNFAKKLESKNKISKRWRRLLKLKPNSLKLSKKVAKRFLECVKIEKLEGEEKKIFENLKRLVNSNLHFLKVKEIKVVKWNDWVYDLSVEDSEMFFGGNLPILLHNSDARGIDVIRGEVKEFARTKAIGDVPFKLIILDEADALTSDAQQALRRTMEMFTTVSRFILICNYSSKIIEPIQSRCAVFRFKALEDKDVEKFIERIVKGENLKIEKSAIEAIINIAEGDLRKVANLLQAAAALKTKVDEDVIYEVASKAKPKEVYEMLTLALKGKFEEARNILRNMLLKEGLAGSDIISEIHKQIYKLPISDEAKIELVEKCGETDFRISEGANELIQLEALLAQFLLYKKNTKMKVEKELKF